ncbi:hypothetical protein C8J56DRAFT_1048255 [Mycena floridula]|nr:hypothetical protein C8J56DRAFT_1048255 [Mycena floridula]
MNQTMPHGGIINVYQPYHSFPQPYYNLQSAQMPVSHSAENFFNSVPATYTPNSTLPQSTSQQSIQSQPAQISNFMQNQSLQTPVMTTATAANPVIGNNAQQNPVVPPGNTVMPVAPGAPAANNVPQVNQMVPNAPAATPAAAPAVGNAPPVPVTPAQAAPLPGLTQAVIAAAAAQMPWDMSLKSILVPWGHPYGTQGYLVWDNWWKVDSAACSIILAKLSPESAVILLHIDNIFRHLLSSQQLYEMLKGAHSSNTWVNVVRIKDQLYNTVSGTSPEQILQTVQKWCTRVASICNANNLNCPVIYADFTKQFVELLPTSGPQWQEAHVSVYRAANAGILNQMVWESILQNVELDCTMIMNQWSTHSHHHPLTPAQPSRRTNVA